MSGPQYQEINLTESKLREAKRSQQGSFKQSMKGSVYGNQQAPGNQQIQQSTERSSSYAGNMLVTTFTQLRQSVSESLSAANDQGIKRSIVRDVQVDQSKKSIHQGSGSIYSSKVEKKEVPQEVLKEQQKDPSSRAVYNQKVADANEEYRTMDDHKIEVEELMERLNSDENNGLGEGEAKRRNLELGDNTLPEGKKTPGWLLFLKEITNWFAIMLWIGGGLCIMAYCLAPSQGLSNVYLSIVLFIVIFLTGAITYMQTAKSDALMDSFKNFLPPQCTVIRDGTKVQIDAAKLVPGDVIELSAGNKIPADVRIIQSRELKVDNSALTGEPDLLLRKRDCTHENALETANLAFFGTLAKEGSGKAVVIRIGSRTVLAQIANCANTGEKVKSPLRIELDRFVLLITVIAITLGIVFFFCAKYVVGYSWINSIVFGIGILVANVPEGLLGCITISLAITAKRLHEKQVLVKNLESVETLGSTSCICSDKTGTLTQNKMTVENVWYDDLKRRAHNRQKFGPGHDYQYDLNDPTFKALHECAVISSEAVFNVPKEMYPETVWLDAPVLGDASETALVKFFQPIEDIEETRKRYSFGKIADGQPAKMPFNSKDKYALCIVEYQKSDSEYCVLLKGAPEKIWARCSYVLRDGGNVAKDAAWEKKFQKINLEFGKNGERVLGFAKIHLRKEEFPLGFAFDTSSPENFNFPLKGLSFVGLISLMDPPKESVPWAVKKCRSAGIKVVMVTGDQPPTAGAIAKQVNIIPNDVQTNVELLEEYEDLTWEQATERAKAIVIHGDKINEAIEKEILAGATEENSDKILREWAKKDFCVFARTTPAQKLKIVRACQRVGFICGVTGDGVNDSPAIKQGDIGISMGITGSDVTKDAADMILLNDDFASIVDGVEEGRKIFDNLKKTIVYLLTSNVTEIFPFLAQIIFLIPLPLSNMLMLCICVGTDILPALSLAYESAEIDTMIRRPRRKAEHMVTAKLINHAYLQMGVIATGGGFFAYFSTMWYYGFQIHGMFSSGLGTVNGAWRCQYYWDDSTGAYLCDQGQNSAVAYTSNSKTNYIIPGSNNETINTAQYYGNQISYLSFNLSNPSLGNPFLFTSNPYYIVGSKNETENLSDLQVEWIAQSCLRSTSKSDQSNINNLPSQTEFKNHSITKVKDVVGSELCKSQNSIDWLYMKDFYFDLRQVIVEFHTSNNSWTPQNDVFGNCQNKHDGKYSAQNNFYSLVHQSPPAIDLTYASKYGNYLTLNNPGTPTPQFQPVPQTDVVVCYSTEALKYAQTAYFIAIVVIQWSNILSCKCKKMPFIYSPFNSVMMYGIALETSICILLAYIPGVQQVFMSRPLNFFAWTTGMINSMALLFWVEVRKALMRREMPKGQENVIEFICDW